MRVRRNKIAVTVAVVALSGGVLAACGSTSTVKSSTSTAKSSTSTVKSSTGSPTIAFVCATGSQQPFFVPIQTGAEAAAKAMGVHMTYTGMTQPSGFSASVIATALKVAIDQKPAALVACDYFPSAEDPLLKLAAKEGIAIFISGASSPVSQNLAVATFEENNYQGGVVAAQKMAAAGVKQALCVDDNPASPSVAIRCVGFAKAGKAAGMTVTIDNLPSGSTSNASLEDTAVKGALAQNHNIGGILMMGPVQGPAAVLAVQQSGLTGKVKVGTFDLSSQVLQDVSNGTMQFAIWQQPYLEGYLPVQAAADYLKYGMATRGLINTGPVIVSKTNVSKVQSEVKVFGG